jgi:single-strand DNA-binding protein
MLNQVMLIGRVGKIYESKLETLKPFSLATTENYRDKSGEWQSKTEWHSCKLFNKETKFEVGDLVLVKGKISTNAYTNKEGVEVSSKEIIADQIRVIDRKSKENETNNQGGGEGLPF